MLKYLLIGACALVTTAAHAEGLKLSGSLGVASEGTSKGLGQTDGDPQYTASVEASVKSGFYAGLKSFNIYVNKGHTFENHSYVGYKGKKGDYSYNVYVLYRVQDNAPAGYDNDVYEFDATVSRKFGNTTLKARAILSPDGFGTAERADWYELGVAHKLNGKWNASLNLATRQTEDAPDYLAWNYGVTYAVTEKLSADLRYYDTDHHERGERYEGRTIFGLVHKF
ncbi:TorF family putative porin [Asticcacaulis sp. YBE204]|uniref:TorF family putative porin n=1 Tax=Asticcacaulis sp. YBE204 TaxID=1282363 RepID=UPI0003C3E65B|nr:TorF family putative porin [Asticcacaulis sp. YBE204]ESQ79829.1 hypothetical protein AEYBE204_08260 [Asticcacaulis sp. YBE204]